MIVNILGINISDGCTGNNIWCWFVQLEEDVISKHGYDPKQILLIKLNILVTFTHKENVQRVSFNDLDDNAYILYWSDWPSSIKDHFLIPLMRY